MIPFEDTNDRIYIKKSDLSNFDTANVTNMRQMFYSASNLRTIYASKDFTTNAVTESKNMFLDAKSLVGGNGTVWNSNYTDKERAKIDKSGQEGYFKEK